MENSHSNQKTESRNAEYCDFLSGWRRALASRPGETAVFLPDGSSFHTFAQLENRARYWANRLLQDCAGEVVALQTGNHPEWPALILGIWYAGKIAMPFDPDLSASRRQEVEELCGACARVERPADEFVLQPLSHPAVSWPTPSPILLKLTSGTSASPRVIRFTGEQLLADCHAICATMGISEEDRNYGVISFAHSYGFSNLITPLLFRGITLVSASDMIPHAVRNGLVISESTVFPGVPALFRALGALDPLPHKLRLCLSAGAPLPRETADRFLHRWGLKIHTFYGSSECGGICYDSTPELPLAEGFVGFPMKGVSLERLGESWPSPVAVRSAAVGQGYHPASPGDELAEGVFRPADLLTETQGGFFLSGRLSDLINVSGRKVNPGEVERVLLLYSKVRETVVVGLPAEGARGEEVAACVVGEASEEELRAHCATALPAWQIPRRWLFLPVLPVNSRGKISRPEIRALF